MLQLILGRAGYGKTEYVFSSIKDLVVNENENPLLIIPEQFSFIAEKRLLTELGEDKVNCVECASFTRLASEISKRCGGNNLPVLNKGAKAVKMKEAIESVQDSLELFNKNRITVSFINSVISIYDEMKSCRVSVEDILDASENTDKEILKRKLKDISIIIAAYDALINGEYYDSANELTRLYERLLNLEYFMDRTVFIDGFNGFVAQEYKVLEVILKQAKKVYITFCTDSYISTDKYDLFSYVNSNIQILRRVTKKAGVEFLEPVQLTMNYRFKNEELISVEKNAFSNIKTKSNNEPENVRLYCAKNICDECDYTAFRISKFLRNGYKASEIAVICRDLDKYERELCYSFNKFNIPYFNDERQSISSQPLIMLVNFVLRTVIYSYKSEDIFSLLKTGLTDLDNDSINALENYVYLWNIKGAAWKKEFTKNPRGFADELTKADEETLESINKSREYVVSVLSSFYKKAKNGSVLDTCKALYGVLRDFSTAKKLKELAIELNKENKTALADEQERIWDMLMDILDKLVLVSGEKCFSLSEFYKLFNLMINSEDLGTVPIGLDNVQFGSADRIRCDNPRAVFVLGANEGEFPKSVISAGLFSESDRVELINNDFKLYSYGETLNAQERYFAYMALCCASEKIFVSYIGTGENAEPSSIVTGIKGVFPNIITEKSADAVSINSIESKANAFEILSSNFNKDSEFISTLEKYFEDDSEYSSRLNAVKRLYSNDDIVLTDIDTAVTLFKKDMYLSASRVEDYYNCAFRYFCKFGLYARPRLKAQMDPMQTGTVIHYVLEQIIKDKGSDGLTLIPESEVKILVDEYLLDYFKNKMGDSEEFTPRFKYQFLRLSKMLVYVVLRLRDEFMHSDFKAKAFELRIGNGEDGESVKSKRIILPDGGSIEIKGAIDRVDVYESNGKKYIRVVDYKSGNKEFRLSDILYGLNLQMFIYLFTLTNGESEYSGISSGVLYMHSSRSYLSLDRGVSPEKIKSEENSSFCMKGVVLNDEENEIAEHMEHELEGKYIPVKYVKKTDSLNGNILSLEEIGRVSRKIEELVKDMGSALHGGKISQNPVNGKGHDKTCDYCDYKDVCMNRRDIKPREIKELDNKEVVEILTEEYDG